MEKDRKIKKYSVIALIVALLGLTVAFAVVSSTLRISGTARANKSGINVVFEKIPNMKISKSNGVLTTLDEPEVKQSGLELDLGDITLNEIGDYYQYSINIVNKGKSTAKISGIQTPNITNEALEYFTPTFRYENGIDVGVNDTIASGQYKKVNIRVELNSNLTDEEYEAMSDDLVLNLNGLTISFEKDSSSDPAIADNGGETEEECSPNPPALGENDITIGTESFYHLATTGGYSYYLAKYNLEYGNVVTSMNTETMGYIYGTPSSVIRQGLDSDCIKVRGNSIDTEGLNNYANSLEDDHDMDYSVAVRYLHFPWKGLVPFSNNNYWIENNAFATNYANNAMYPSNSFATKSNGDVGYVYDSNSSIYSYLSSDDANDGVESYYEYLHGINSNVVEARLITYEEIIALGCDDSERSCQSAPSFLTYTSYWTGSALPDDKEDYNGVFGISNDGGYEREVLSESGTYGVRPVIVVANN